MSDKFGDLTGYDDLCSPFEIKTFLHWKYNTACYCFSFLHFITALRKQWPSAALLLKPTFAFTQSWQPPRTHKINFTWAGRIKKQPSNFKLKLLASVKDQGCQISPTWPERVQLVEHPAVVNKLNSFSIRCAACNLATVYLSLIFSPVSLRVQHNYTSSLARYEILINISKAVSVLF